MTHGVSIINSILTQFINLCQHNGNTSIKQMIMYFLTVKTCFFIERKENANSRSQGSCFVLITACFHQLISQTKMGGTLNICHIFKHRFGNFNIQNTGSFLFTLSVVVFIFNVIFKIFRCFSIVMGTWWWNHLITEDGECRAPTPTQNFYPCSLKSTWASPLFPIPCMRNLHLQCIVFHITKLNRMSLIIY